jgi:hypothetical protein
MSTDIPSRSGSPYPWFLDVRNGAIDPKSPEARSFIRHDLVPRGAALSGTVLRYTIKNRGDHPRQDVRMHDLFSSVAEALGVNDHERVEELRLAVRELEANADENSTSGLTEFSFTHLDCQPGLVGFVASNIVPDNPVGKTTYDDEVFVAPSESSELDKLIAGLMTHGRGSLLVDEMTGGRHGRFTYNDLETRYGQQQRKLAAYAIVDTTLSPQTSQLPFAA